MRVRVRRPSMQRMAAAAEPVQRRRRPQAAGATHYRLADIPVLPMRRGGSGQGRVRRLSGVEDCTADQRTAIERAAADADAAIPRVVNLIMATPQAPRTQAAFRRYFGSSSPAAIALRLLYIRQGLRRATVECESPGSWLYDHFCGDALAYVRPVPAMFGFGNIHVCQPEFHRISAERQMSTLVHEGAHRYADAWDNAYYTPDCQETATTRAMSDSERRLNADSYGCLVQVLA
jgi:hypothetical protein